MLTLEYSWWWCYTQYNHRLPFYALLAVNAIIKERCEIISTTTWTYTRLTSIDWLDYFFRRNLISLYRPPLKNIQTAKAKQSRETTIQFGIMWHHNIPLKPPMWVLRYHVALLITKLMESLSSHSSQLCRLGQMMLSSQFMRCGVSEHWTHPLALAMFWAGRQETSFSEGCGHRETSSCCVSQQVVTLSTGSFRPVSEVEFTLQSVMGRKNVSLPNIYLSGFAFNLYTGVFLSEI